MAVAPEAVHLVEDEDDLDRLELDGDAHVALLAQTTLAHDEWEGHRRARPRALPRPVDARTIRPLLRHDQPPGALKAIAPRCDAMIVLGSANSSNTVALAKVAAAAGCARVLRVNAPSEVPDDLAGVVGVTAGASAPDWLVEDLLARLGPDTRRRGRARPPRRTSTSLPRPSCATCSGAWRSRRPEPRRQSRRARP